MARQTPDGEGVVDGPEPRTLSTLKDEEVARRQRHARAKVREHYDAFAEAGFSEDAAAKLALAAVMREQKP